MGAILPTECNRVDAGLPDVISAAGVSRLWARKRPPLSLAGPLRGKAAGRRQRSHGAVVLLCLLENSPDCRCLTAQCTT